MNKITTKFSKNIEKEFTTFTTKNGLNVYFINDYKEDAIVTFFINYGAIDWKFKLDGKELIKPNGIAHFLEHKMFENDQDIPYFEQVKREGFSANAYTSSVHTNYHLAGPKAKIKKIIEMEFGLISSLIIDDASVEKEKKIILQESNMTKDDKSYVALFKMLNATYNCGDWENVIGSDEDIKRTTTQDLYDCFNAMYSTKNMVCVIIGNFSDSEIKELIPLIDEKADLISTKDVELISVEDIDNPKIKFDQRVVETDIENPVKSYTKLFDLSNYKVDEINKISFALEMINAYISSPLNEKLSQFKIDNSEKVTSINFFTETIRGFKKALFMVQASDISAVDNYLKEIFKFIDITDEDLIILKKNYEVSKIQIADQADKYASSLLNRVIEGENFIEESNKATDINWSLNASEIKEIFNDLLKEEKYIIFKGI